eukprot:TRINITY_DN7529_c0_g1_i2.p1 TRINITY_DN7529_c0_g1~~TRINITY_DN7529_c0_g1_i2.p1  ORF type:complete len:866 (+),score=159.11 TRINITY_DN7529_c0_g1_i2:248-2845(+)
MENLKSFSLVPTGILITSGKIFTSIIATNDVIYTGSSDGRVCCWEFLVDDPRNCNEIPEIYPSLKIDRLIKKRKAIRKLEIFHDEFLMVLIDDKLELLNLVTLEHSGVQFTKVTNFIFDRTNDNMFCIQSKKKLTMYEYERRNFVTRKEIVLPEVAVQLEWIDTIIAVAFRKEYQLLHVESGEYKSLFSYVGEAHILAVSSDEFLFVRDGSKGIFVNKMGNETRSLINWDRNPICIGYNPPYILSLKGYTIEMNNEHTSERIQFIQSNEKFSGICNGQKYSFVYSATGVYCMVPFPIEDQVFQLIEAGNVVRGLELFVQTSKYDPIFREKLKGFHELAGDVLFRKSKFYQAKDYYLQSNVDPRKLLLHYPDLTNERVEYLYRDILPVTNIMILTIKPQKIVLGRRNTISGPQMGLLKEAKDSLMKFLEASKEKHTQDAEIMREIDIALLKLYAEVDPRLMEPLIKSSEMDIPYDEVEALFTEKRLWYSLAILYKCTYRERSALDIWRKLGLRELLDKDYNGIEESTELLSTISDFEYLQEYSDWIYSKDVDNFKRIFTSTNRDSSAIPHDLVLNYLTKYGVDMKEFYLEFLVNELQSSEEKYHNLLANHYMQKVLALVTTTNSDLNQGKELQEKFQQFLKFSKYYDPYTLLASTESHHLPEEKVILLTRIGNYTEAMRIIVDIKKDYKRAEQYCFHVDNIEASDDIYSFLSPNTKTLLHDLLSLYIELSETQGLSPDYALQLLKDYPTNFNPVLVLEILPPSIPLVEVQDYLKVAVRNSHSVYRKSQIIKNMESSQNLKCKIERIKHESKWIKITRDSVCPVCKKRFKDNTAIACFPNGIVVHYSCFDDPHTCPVTGQNFPVKQE